MGTRSRIAAKNADGTFTSIYCHWDGYPEHVGKILNEHYQDEAKVRALLALGDISSLGQDTDSTVAYGRDKGEADVQGEVCNGIEALRNLTKDSGGEWLYVYDNGAWLCAEGGIAYFGNPSSKKPGRLTPVSQALQSRAS